MMPAARIQAVIELIAEVIAVPRPADTLANYYFRSRRYIGSKDRAAINTRFYRLLREYHRLSWWIMRAGCTVTPRTLVIAAVMFEGELVGKTIGAAFSGDKFAPAPMDKEEKKLVNFLDGKDFVTPEMSLSARTECPDWAFESLKRALGPKFETELSAMLTPPTMDLRVNIIKATRDEVLEQLQEDGIDAQPGKISPLSIRVHGRPQLAQHPLFREGFFEIQDEGSQMVALVADAKPGEQVVDFCAGAGGKTLALAAAMNNKGRVIAMDVLGGRLLRAKERFKRAGLHNIETRTLTGERDRYVKRHQGSFDLVLVDAPCSGTGTWRRDPDKRWRQLGPGLDNLVPLQKNILDSAYRMVKPGGRLVYATCSLLPEENETQVETFLAEHPEFEVKPVSSIIKTPGVGKYLQMTPAQHDTDGFFAAVLTRKTS